ncbi:hypothetical protein HYH03_001747 [Edaphochlamys debaryana]|uniref:NadR/Ttd14 AAA domain-containing protein n=1 Tax=Edaphochlamys debaryana TaxID=47281 RepID=A0A835YKC2_9CHLO|nr:hypothetical protein HYH03_001747 [Edaphochlamys debaryana]|eukprot:KAG2500165.1 hypothetical protein HYH03_001747 [Edaphochlamys debaryana]
MFARAPAWTAAWTAAGPAWTALAAAALLQAGLMLYTMLSRRRWQQRQAASHVSAAGVRALAPAAGPASAPALLLSAAWSRACGALERGLPASLGGALALWRGTMAEAAQRFAPGGVGVRSVSLVHFGRMHFVDRWYEAQQVFRSPALHMRLGNEEGLSVLGMQGQGVIWNNDWPRWALDRKIFTEAVQPAGIQDASSPAGRWLAALCRDCVSSSLQQAAGHATAPSAEPESKSKAGSLVLLDGLGLLRAVTCRVTLALAFGLAPSALSWEELGEVVAAVGDYFKAWEFFLLRPPWLLRRTAPREARRHEAAVERLRGQVRSLLARATGGSWPPPGPVRLVGLPGAYPGPNGKPPSFILALLSGLHAPRPEDRLAVGDAEQAALEMLLAGTDTSSVTLYYALLALRDDPALQGQLREELATGRASPALWALLSESMRFKPVGPVVIRRASEAVALRAQAGPHVVVAAGDTVVVNLAAMHRDPGLFPFPDVFDVRNFLEHPAVEHEPSRDVLAATTVDRCFMPFGSGRKGCVGFLLALAEMEHILPALLAAAGLPTLAEAAEAVGPEAAARLAPPLGQLRTRWEVASQPTESHLIALTLRPPVPKEEGIERPATPSDRPLPARALGSPAREPPAPGHLTTPQQWVPEAPPPEPTPVRPPVPPRRVYLVGAGGVGKTTLLWAAAEQLMAAGFETRSEVARQLLAERKVTRAQLEHEDETFLRFQEAVLRRHAELEAADADGCGSGSGPSARCMSDRSGVDALVYAAQRFGEGSAQLAELLALPETQALLRRYADAEAACLHVLVPPFQPPPAPPTPQPEPAQADAAALRQGGAGARGEAAGGGSAVEDDGVRIRSSAAGLWGYTAAVERLLRALGLPYGRLSAGGVEARREELLTMLLTGMEQEVEGRGFGA